MITLDEILAVVAFIAVISMVMIAVGWVLYDLLKLILLNFVAWTFKLEPRKDGGEAEAPMINQQDTADDTEEKGYFW